MKGDLIPTVIAAIINQKGGVGKTTTTLNLGAALARNGKRVLLVDLDTQESLQKFVDLEQSGSQIVAATSRTLKRVVEQTTIDGETPDFILIDCPPILDREAAAAIALADLVIAPVPPRYLDVAGFALLRQTVQEAAARANPRLKLKLLITMRDSRLGIHGDYERKIRSAFGNEVFKTTVPRAGVFDKAADANTSVFGLEPSSRAAQAFTKLAAEVSALAASSKP